MKILGNELNGTHICIVLNKMFNFAIKCKLMKFKIKINGLHNRLSL